ncbi:FitA-like ribbon-helix-helix domain-containing protein [Nocardioides sp. URHA0032]|uniref:FitA-like ribbon-helix-helix domain-containing protein n=1 Tax=Nocardioides sp. URHA0032 TaxID=1380388 RepID=UPI003FA5E133
MLRRQNVPMPSIQIKGVPEETHTVLRERAAAANQSLQEYLRSWLIAEASRPTLDEVLARAGGRSGWQVTFRSSSEAVRDHRATR